MADLQSHTDMPPPAATTAAATALAAAATAATAATSGRGGDTNSAPAAAAAAATTQQNGTTPATDAAMTDIHTEDAPAPFSQPSTTHEATTAAANTAAATASAASSALAHPSIFTTTLQRLSSENSLVELLEGLETLLVYTKNLILYPEEKKYRKIKITNIHYQERLGHLTGAEAAMTAIGYVPQGEYLRLDEARIHSPTNEAVLVAIEKEIVTKLNDLKKQWSMMPQRTEPAHAFTSVHAVGCHSAIGKRPNMEDDEIMIDDFGGVPTQGYFGLYDGHGGRATVDFVVKALHMNLEQHMKRHPAGDLASAFKHSYLTTDGQLRRQSILRSGTTSVTCVVRVVGSKRFLTTANVGDSRAVLCRGTQAIRLTVDHKASLPEEAKRIRDAGGFIGRNKRVNGVLAISRALGDHMLKTCGGGLNDVVSAEPHCEERELTPEDQYILMACDGVWDVLDDQQAVEFLLAKVAEYEAQIADAKRKGNGASEEAASTAAAAMSSNESDAASADGSSNSSSLTRSEWNEVLNLTATALVKEALDRRSLDNVTVVIVKL